VDVGGGRLRDLPPEQPVVGWRYWQLTPRHRLRSVTQKWIEWEPGAPMLARCLEQRHPAPDSACGCGLHASHDLETLRDHGLCLVPDVGLVVGRVALWGRVASDERAWRGQWASPVELTVAEGTVPGGAPAVAQAVAALGAYGVPVSVVALEEAVAGATRTMLEMQAMSLRASRNWAP
jgi:hypothetical protein